MHRMLLVCMIAIGLAMGYESAQASICESTAVDVAGGAAAGTAATGVAAGTTITGVAITSGGGVLVATAPAIAPVVVVGAIVGAAAYGGVKATCFAIHKDENGKTGYDRTKDRVEKQWKKLYERWK